MTVKKSMGWLLSLAILAGTLGGCGSQPEAEEPQQPQERGRYVETEKSLPENLADLTIKQIFTVEDSVHLLTAAQGEGITTLQEWEMQGKEFVEVTDDWMAELELPCETWAEMQLLRGDEVPYLFVRMVNEAQYYQGYLWRGEDSGAMEITPEKWTVPNETWGSYENILGIAAMGDGKLTAVSYTSIDFLSGEDGSVLESREVNRGYGDTMLTDGKNIFITTLADSGLTEALEKWPEGKSEDAERIPLPTSVMGGIYLCALEDGALVAAGSDGVFRYNVVSESWDQLLSGSDTSFALTTCWCTGLTALSDGRIFALFHQEGGGVSLMEYAYDPEAVTEVTAELKLYTVWENTLLKQAAVMYHRAHPEVLITVEYAYSINDRYSGEAPDYDQVYQMVNTMLMGEEAPDILVMDHLKTESYAEKGLLADISDVVGPLEADGTLLANITGAYDQEGVRYVVPLQFGFPMAIGKGNEIGAEDMASLKALAEFLAGKQESYMGPLTVSELVDQFYPYFGGDIVKGDQLDREALGEALGYLKVIGDNSGIVESRGKEERKYTMWDLPAHAKLAFETVDGFWDCMTPIALREYVQGEFAGFEDCFVPHLLTGINARSEYLDTARDFLRFALSEEVQETEIYNGFPVNRGALESLAAADRSELAMATGIVTEDGGMEIFEILDYSEEIAQELKKICEGLKRPAMEDEKIREELIAALPSYLAGSSTLEATIDAIEGGLRMYLAE